MEEIVAGSGGLLSLLRSANLFGKSSSACDDFGSGMDVSSRQEVGTLVHIVSQVMAGLATLFNHVLLLVSMWLCESANLTLFVECADVARLLASFWLARVQWATGCGQSGNVVSLICVGGGASTLGSEASTLGGDAHSLGVDNGANGATLRGGAGMSGCVEIGDEGG